MKDPRVLQFGNLKIYHYRLEVDLPAELYIQFSHGGWVEAVCVINPNYRHPDVHDLVKGPANP